MINHKIELNDNEENKVPPGDSAFFHLIGLNEEEIKASDAFIAKLNSVKVEQDLKNQTVMKNINEERYFGNTEYKLKLTQSNNERILRLTTQMKFRIQEGSGEAFYMIGVGDKGEATGIPTDEMEISLRKLHKMATVLGAEISIISVKKGQEGEIVKVRVA